jgi:hypothetical protein
MLFSNGTPNFLIPINVLTIDATATEGGIVSSCGRLQILDKDTGNVLTHTTYGRETGTDNISNSQYLVLLYSFRRDNRALY